MDKHTAKAYSDEVVIVRVGMHYPPSAVEQITSVLRSRGVASVVIACEDVAVVRSTLPQATPKPIDQMEIPHPDDVELLRREVRAWREWHRIGGVGPWDDVAVARINTDKAGALG